MSNKYRCNQQELYAVCTFGWDNCAQNLLAFANFSPKYTEAFIKERQEEIIKVSSIPNMAQRSYATESLRIELQVQLRICLDHWQRLKRYISVAFPSNFYKTKLKGAGNIFYRRASSYNWEACQGLIKTANTFLVTESAALLAGNNMPANFAAEFSKSGEAFMALYHKFLQSSKSSAIRTREKSRSDQKLYEDLMAMFLHGQAIFKKQPEIQKQFIFEQALLIVSGPGVAGLKGTITSKTGNAVPVVGALVSITELDHTAITDEEGWFQFMQLPSGIYSVEVKATGYKDLIVDKVEIKTGTMSNLYVRLDPS